MLPADDASLQLAFASFLGDGGGGEGDGEDTMGAGELLLVSSNRTDSLAMYAPQLNLTYGRDASWPVNTRKLAWFHVPKCGTSIGATFARYLDPSLPLNTAIPSCNSSDPCRSVPEVEFLMRHPLPDGAYWKKEGNWGDHKDVGPRVFERWKGHFAGLFRHPARRALSAFSFFKGHPDLSKKQYAQQVAGTAVRMLAGQRYGLDCNACCNCAKSQPPPNTPLALERLRTGFSFVGMTDDYRMSVCLFHARFGGTCTRAEFANMRPTSKPSNEHSGNEAAADWTRQLEGFVDHDDLALFQAAHARFCNDLKTHQVTQATCRNVICPAAADLFDDAPTGSIGCAE